MALLFTILAVTLLSICAPIIGGQHPVTVYIKPGSQPNVKGELVFEQQGKEVVIKGKITGLTPGNHGFHIHEKGDLTDYCKAAGLHFNPYGKAHGDISDPVRHAGDLGNVEADRSGTANIHLVDQQISLNVSSKSYIGGRAIVIHEKEDDLGKGGSDESLKTGNAGLRAGCGYISAGHQPSIIAPLQLIFGFIICVTVSKKIF